MERGHELHASPRGYEDDFGGYEEDVAEIEESAR